MVLEQVYFGTPEAAFWGIISIITISLNIACIVRLSKSSAYVTEHGIYLRSLLLSNVLVGVLTHPVMAYISYVKLQFGQVNKAATVFLVYNSSVSAASTLAIAINRMKSFAAKRNIMLNAVQRRRMKKRHIFCASLIWFVSCLLCIPQALQPHTLTSSIFLIPICVMATVALYIQVLAGLYSFKKRSFLTRARLVVYRKLQSSSRLIKLLLSEILIFWLPWILVNVLHGVLGKEQLVISTLVSKMFLLVPVIDPFCYMGLYCCARRDNDQRQIGANKLTPLTALKMPQITIRDRQLQTVSLHTQAQIAPDQDTNLRISARKTRDISPVR